jgi:hypothetical protein
LGGAAGIGDRLWIGNANYAEAVLRGANFDAKDRQEFTVIPGRIADANRESGDPGLVFRTISE